MFLVEATVVQQQVHRRETARCRSLPDTRLQGSQDRQRGLHRKQTGPAPLSAKQELANRTCRPCLPRSHWDGQSEGQVREDTAPRVVEPAVSGQQRWSSMWPPGCFLSELGGTQDRTEQDTASTDMKIAGQQMSISLVLGWYCTSPFALTCPPSRVAPSTSKSSWTLSAGRAVSLGPGQQAGSLAFV